MTKLQRQDTGHSRQAGALTDEVRVAASQAVRDWLGAGRSDDFTTQLEIDLLLETVVHLLAAPGAHD